MIGLVITALFLLVVSVTFISITAEAYGTRSRDKNMGVGFSLLSIFCFASVVHAIFQL